MSQISLTPAQLAQRSAQLNRLGHLAIKLRSLAAEITMIHRAEIRAKSRASRRNRRLNAKAGLTGDSRTFPHTPGEYGLWALRDHRYDLKTLIRTNYLAYGFLRGVPYAEMERVCRDLPEWAPVRAIAERFYAGPKGCALFEASWKAWVAGDPTAHVIRWGLEPEPVVAAPEPEPEPVKELRSEPSGIFGVVGRAFGLI